MKINLRANTWQSWTGRVCEQPPERSDKEKAESVLQSQAAKEKPRRALRRIISAARHMRDLTPAEQRNFARKHGGWELGAL